MCCCEVWYIQSLPVSPEILAITSPLQPFKDIEVRHPQTESNSDIDSQKPISFPYLGDERNCPKMNPFYLGNERNAWKNRHSAFQLKDVERYLCKVEGLSKKYRRNSLCHFAQTGNCVSSCKNCHFYSQRVFVVCLRFRAPVGKETANSPP